MIVFPGIVLPQHTNKDYKLYISDRTDSYAVTKVHILPEINPGDKIYLEGDGLYDRKRYYYGGSSDGFIAS